MSIRGPKAKENAAECLWQANFHQTSLKSSENKDESKNQDKWANKSLIIWKQIEKNCEIKNETRAELNCGGKWSKSFCSSKYFCSSKWKKLNVQILERGSFAGVWGGKFWKF